MAKMTVTDAKAVIKNINKYNSNDLHQLCETYGLNNSECLTYEDYGFELIRGSGNEVIEKIKKKAEDIGCSLDEMTIDTSEDYSYGPNGLLIRAIRAFSKEQSRAVLLEAAEHTITLAAHLNEQRKASKKLRDEQDRKEYERLKKKFEKV